MLPVQTEHELIRLGPNSDGGYLIPNDLEGVELCISPGTGSETGFETELLKWQINSVLIDKDHSGAPAQMPENSVFINRFVSGFDSENTISLNQLVESSKVKGDLILQMDIEGHEYNALTGISRENLDKFRIIVIEFHYTFDWIFDHNWNWQYAQIFSKLLENHTVVHSHPNNAGGFFKYAGIKYPNLIEVTLLRRDRIKEFRGRIYENHVLDRDDNPGLPTMKKSGLGIS